MNNKKRREEGQMANIGPKTDKQQIFFFSVQTNTHTRGLLDCNVIEMNYTYTLKINKQTTEIEQRERE